MQLWMIAFLVDPISICVTVPAAWRGTWQILHSRLA